MLVFSQGHFPNDKFPSVELPKCAISQATTSQRLGYASDVPQGAERRGQTVGGGLALRLGQTWEVAAWEIAHLGSFATWENTIRKLPLVHGACDMLFKNIPNSPFFKRLNKIRQVDKDKGIKNKKNRRTKSKKHEN